MDILAHGLWTGAIYKAGQRKKPTLNIKWAIFWGVFPDLFAFTVPFAVLIYNILTGAMRLSSWPTPGTSEPGLQNSLAIFHQTGFLYSVGHSAITFAAVFLLAWLLKKRPVWELGGWLLHILIDIPTHSYRFYPTPVFWPLSAWRFNGLSWATPWFMAVNYLALLSVYAIILRKKRNASKS